MQHVKVITIEKVVFDLVGPFPRSKDGYKYLLTATCLATKFPHATPLKDIRAETVAEAMVQLFMEQGIPLQILTDKGTQFVSALMAQVLPL